MSQMQLCPYVNFQGRAREAMEFYHKLLGGKLDLRTSNEQGVPRPAGPGDRITDSRLEVDGLLLIGSDGHPSYPAHIGDHMALALRGTDKERLTRIFNGLAEGGQIQMPLTRQPSGAEVGWLRDRFGIHWTAEIVKS